MRYAEIAPEAPAVLVVLLVLLNAALWSAASTLVVHAKVRPDAASLAALLGLFFGPVGLIVAACMSTRDDLDRAAERRRRREEQRVAEWQEAEAERLAAERREQSKPRSISAEELERVRRR